MLTAPFSLVAYLHLPGRHLDAASGLQRFDGLDRTAEPDRARRLGRGEYLACGFAL
jgi:hypothetical protein